MATSAQDIGRVLAEAGVERAFVVGSNHNLKVLGGLQAAGIQCLPNRCEVGAVHAADGHARVSGARTVVVTSTGPGAGNAVGAFCAAAKDGSPVVHVSTTHFPGGPRAQGVHTILDQGGWHRSFDAPVLDAAALDAETIGKELSACVGAVTIVVPDDERRCHPLPTGDVPRRSEPSDVDTVALALDEWAGADRPLLWIGGGARDVDPKTLVAIAERSGAAVVTTVQGKGLFPGDHPNFAGCTLQSALTKDAVAGATSCLALGTRLTELSTAAWADFPPHLVRIGYSNEEPPFPATRQVALAVDASSVCADLDGILHSDPMRTFGAECGQRYRDGRAEKDRDAPEYQLLDAIASSLQPGDVLVCDMTKLAFWALLAMTLPQGVRWLWPGMLNMGFGLPAGIGAAVAAPGQHVVVLCGDGGLISIAPELDTVTETPGRLSIVMIDDDGYGLLRPFASEAVSSGLCTFPGPDWRTLAAAFHIEYTDVTGGDDLRGALDGNKGGASLIRVDGTELFQQNWRQA